VFNILNFSAVEEDKTFSDRRDAGRVLGKLLTDRFADKDALVLGIPRGGVLVAYEVAITLHGELSVLITKKLPHPLQQEMAIGACAEDGSVFLTSLAEQLDSQVVQEIVKAQNNEIKSRIRRFRDGKPLPQIKGRITIIVDDGIATGSTIVPAIKLCRARQARQVLVGCPVSGRHYVPEIDTLADEVVIVQKPRDFYAVGQVYQDFHHLSDDEVTDVLHDFERSHAADLGERKHK
jgi:putative phosphoribosyl transferase